MDQHRVGCDEDAEVICCGEERTEPESKASIYIPTLIYGHELWVVDRNNEVAKYKWQK